MDVAAVAAAVVVVVVVVVQHKILSMVKSSLTALGIVRIPLPHRGLIR